MKHTFLFFSFLIAFYCFVSCTNSGVKQLESNKITLLDIPKSTSAASQLVDSVDFVLLEETNDNAFSGINKILLSNDNFIVYDKATRGPIMVFGADGKFITTIGCKGNAESEYATPWDISVRGDSVLVYDRGKHKMMWFLLNGEFVKAIPCSLPLEGFTLLDNGHFLVFARINDDEFGVYTLNQAMEIESKVLDLEKSFASDLSFDNSFQRSRNVILFNNPLNYRIYEFDSFGSLLQCYDLDFWGSNVPKDLYNSYEDYCNKGGLGQFVHISDCPCVFSDLFLFQVCTDDSQAILAFDSTLQKSYLTYWNENTTIRDLVLPSFVDDSFVYGWIDESVLIMKDFQNALPKNVYNHLSNGGKVIVKYHIKNE